MMQNQTNYAENATSRWSRFFAVGMIAGEAAIATTVFSVFMSVFPTSFSDNPSSAAIADLHNPSKPVQIISLHLPVKVHSEDP